MFPKRGMVQLSGPELAQDDSHHPALSGFALTSGILELSPLLVTVFIFCA